MKIIIDSNRIIAALLKDSTTRNLIFNKRFEFIAPSYIFSEINKYKDYIIKKTRISNEGFETLLKLIFENIKIIPQKEYWEFLIDLKDELSDQKDISYLAVAALTKAKGVWTHDLHFKEQSKIKIFTNIDLIKFVNEEN